MCLRVLWCMNICHLCFYRFYVWSVCVCVYWVLFTCMCSVYCVHACLCQLWQNKFWSAWEDEYIYMFTSHAAAISTFKWHFCPDKYWKWTRPPLCTFLRLHHFAAHRHIHIRAMSDRNSASSALECHKYKFNVYFVEVWKVDGANTTVSKHTEKCHWNLKNISTMLSIEIWI